jgi:tyrosinase
MDSTINGDPGGDLFVSPGDPAVSNIFSLLAQIDHKTNIYNKFYVHHAQVDRVYALWQALDQTKREKELSGTRTWLNQPPSPDTTLQDIIDLGYAAPNIKIGDVMSTVGGPLCYIYL